MVSQFLRGYNGAFNFTEVMNMDAEIFFTYYRSLSDVMTFEAGKEIKHLQQGEPQTPDLKAFKKFNKEFK
jgi:hypothetical protein